MNCVHVCPATLKLTSLLRDYLADDTRSELAAKLTQKKCCGMFSHDDKASMKESLMKLSTVALMSRNHKSLPNLKKKSMFDVLKQHFNVGTEKPKATKVYDGSYPLEHAQLVDLRKNSTYQNAKILLKQENKVPKDNKQKKI